LQRLYAIRANERHVVCLALVMAEALDAHLAGPVRPVGGPAEVDAVGVADGQCARTRAAGADRVDDPSEQLAVRVGLGEDVLGERRGPIAYAAAVVIVRAVAAAPTRPILSRPGARTPAGAAG
jgi:hypothetical protein